MTPLLACGTGPAGAASAAALTFVAAGAWGWGEATLRSRRVDAVAETRWGPAIPCVVGGRALVRISGWPSPAGSDRWRAPARVLQFEGEDDRNPIAGPKPDDGIMLGGANPAPEFGQRILCSVAAGRPRGAGIPGAFDYRRHLAGRSLTWTGKLDENGWTAADAEDPAAVLVRAGLEPLRRGIVQRLQRLLPERESTLAVSVLLGARDAGSRRAAQPFADLGLAHLFAVSGLHVGILLGIALLPGRAMHLGPAGRSLPIILLLPPYIVLTGMPGSVLRAAGLGSLALLAPLLGRRLEPLRTLGLLYWVGILWDPMGGLDTGLRLSYLAAGGILAVSRVSGGLQFGGPRLFALIAGGLAVTLAAQWFTLPVAAQTFGRISLLAPLANLIAVPVFGLGVWLTVAALALEAVLPGVGQAVAAWAWITFRSLAALVSWAATGSGRWEVGLPEVGALQVITWAVLTVGLLGGMHHLHTAGRRRAALGLLAGSSVVGLLLMAPAVWRPVAAQEIVLQEFDVGQGDCGLLTFPDGWKVLLDSAGAYGFSGDADGPFVRDVLPWLRRAHIRALDAVVLTHGHRDHTAGARVAAEQLRVGRWYCGGSTAAVLAGLPDTAAVVIGRAGMVLHRWRQWELSLVYPLAGLPDGMHENDRSLVIALRHADRTKLVWSGDLEEAGEALLLASDPRLGETEVWKAGHHGSATSGSRAFLARLRPSLILISCGVGNRYGHPSHEPYLVDGDTVATLRTDLCGTATVRWTADTGTVDYEAVWLR